MYFSSSNRNKIISIWLGIMCFCVVLMIFVGGVTRLTKSGLSITEWKPVSGIVPPLNIEEWNLEFDKYKNSPEYQKINYDLNFAEFKTIYLIEFIHRILGRLVGLIFIIPLIVFSLNGFIAPREYPIYFVGVILFFAQGLMGWYMVKSGLISDPHVCHFRLAAHLFLAVMLYTLFFRQYLKNKGYILLIPSATDVSYLRKWCIMAIIVLLIQIIFGAFVAGLNAGHIYNEFPYMGGALIPYEIKVAGISLKSFMDPVFVQFIHRMCAYLLSFIIIIICIKGLKINNKQFSLVIAYIFAILIIQVLVGILTLLYNVPIELALFHQFGAICLLSSLLTAYTLLCKVL